MYTAFLKEGSDRHGVPQGFPCGKIEKEDNFSISKEKRNHLRQFLISKNPTTTELHQEHFQQTKSKTNKSRQV